MNLEELYSTTQTKFSFDEKNYPPLSLIQGSEQDAFVLRHILIHQQKVLGKIASVVESMDHGDTLDKEFLISQSVKLFTNILQFAGKAGVSFNEFENGLINWNKSIDVE